uniref:C3H1-type domain-containing protein n=1 Tax=Cacopsylla melanoneura TaxID=428564 RepID=A0A8D8LDC6_9HEMI
MLPGPSPQWQFPPPNWQMPYPNGQIKTALCLNYLRKNGTCPRDQCPYAHGVEELDREVTKYYYKLKWCPFGELCNHQLICPDIHSCGEIKDAQIFVFHFTSGIVYPLIR